MNCFRESEELTEDHGVTHLAKAAASLNVALEHQMRGSMSPT
jgi:hypothetical protein